jgi:hypothetical protein
MRIEGIASAILRAFPDRSIYGRGEEHAKVPIRAEIVQPVDPAPATIPPLIS